MNKIEREHNRVFTPPPLARFRRVRYRRIGSQKFIAYHTTHISFGVRQTTNLQKSKVNLFTVICLVLMMEIEASGMFFPNLINIL